ncbi:chitin synthase 1, partial [Biomphalaria pfeifferi]
WITITLVTYVRTDKIFWITTSIIRGLIIVKFSLGALYSWHILRSTRSNAKTTPSIMRMTCYNKGKDGIKNTLDSLCKQEYNYKLIVVICDREITRPGNKKTIPEIVLNLCDFDQETEPKTYVSLAHEAKRCNKARMYAGHYHVEEEQKEDRQDGAVNHGTRVIVISKCRDPTETEKTGNRGKRDNQVILMSFFSKIIHGHEMSELDMELHQKMKLLMPHMDPNDFEYILMADVDTTVKPDALPVIINVIETDRNVIGVCGETTMENEFETWVTMIQVFEYYISSYLSKDI